MPTVVSFLTDNEVSLAHVWHSAQTSAGRCGDNKVVHVSGRPIHLEGCRMRLRFLLAVGATIALAGCGEATTSPQTMRPGARSADDIECRSGYHIATRIDGTETCEPDGGVESMATRPDSTGL